MRFIGNAPVDGEVRAIASGALATGDTVIVNSDGTVSVVAPVSASAGTPVVFENALTTYTSIIFDNSSNKVVISYVDNGNSGYGTAIVGTVSGTSISFGTPVVFESAEVYYAKSVFDSNSNKVVISYTDYGNSNHGTAIVGTVSGTSISFGSPVVFESAGTVQLSSTFDSNSSKVLIAYRDQGNSDYGTAIVGTVSGTSISFGTPVVYQSSTGTEGAGSFDIDNNKFVIAYRDTANSTYGTAVVGTVSGTSISFGSPVVFESADCEYVSAVFDAGAGKVLIAYQNNGNSGYGTAIVGTVSGTSISFGSPVVFEAATIFDTATTFDSNSSTVVIAYRDVGNSNYGTAIVGTIGGTSISFDTPVVFEDARIGSTSATFDSASNQVVIAYRDSGNSNYGTAVVFKTPSSTLTSENFVGFANSGYADGQSAAINSTCSVDKNQSGLTAGETYYVQTDGTLGTTPASPSVVAGTAISSNSIIVKG
jgi:hypothetical protein